MKQQQTKKKQQQQHIEHRQHTSVLFPVTVCTNNCFAHRRLPMLVLADGFSFLFATNRTHESGYVDGWALLNQCVKYASYCTHSQTKTQTHTYTVRRRDKRNMTSRQQPLLFIVYFCCLFLCL